jgi:ankyrin repeat protein
VSSDANVLKLVLDAGADVMLADECGDTPLHRAVESGHVPSIRLLLSRDADPSAVNDAFITPLHLAAVSSAQVLASVLRSGEMVDFPDSRGRTPLFHAAMQNCEDNLQCLLDANADPFLVDQR